MPKSTASKTKRSSKARPALKWLKIPIIPVKKARLLLFVLLFANIGLVYLNSTQAAAYNVRFVYFCASDACSGVGTPTVDSYGNQVQSWYTGQLGGKHFYKLLSTGIRGSHPAAYYRGYGAYSTANTYTNVKNELNAKGYINGYTKVVVVLGFHSMDHCGTGAGGFAISDPFIGTCGSLQPSVLAHELGHTWLASTNADHRTDGTVMHTPYACNGRTLSYCVINSGQKPTIASRPWFYY